ncbi:pre-mRNA splicing factor ini1 [Coprinopsis cinerea okayama7|uniref:Pre-mRNA splicing factor ini1 n=1 Tax=Coprinopsis cinerea (strain Okayama-7 / 130 / ATCC MYA-4618 / FGSC 9003) TaxID=240176 RepID=D6RNX4_COPC7|nr:pre-mRNA splicing factor ini1 [Coprinopsis cinerea okayama7\|eukprot:XP_002910892.1 pre-mRNA splicing factor ini1 [Coprinopsis cinerea okayama7\
MTSVIIPGSGWSAPRRNERRQMISAYAALGISERQLFGIQSTRLFDQHFDLPPHTSHVQASPRSYYVSAPARHRPVCDSYVRPETLVRICDECNFGTYGGRCIICGSPGISDAYYCAECTRLEKDRDGCPKIVNLGASRTDLFYERRRLGFKKG